MQMMVRTVGVLALAYMQPLKISAPSVGAALVLCGLLFAYTSSPAWANTITVNSLADDADPNDGECTLREAITAANTDTSSGMATGECAAGSGDDGIDIGLTGTVNLTGALPNLSSNLAIAGPGADEFTVRRDSGGNYRIFTVTGDTTVVSISEMTISNGISNGSDPSDHAGGIANIDNGTLTVTDSTISENSATFGGGIANHGTLTVTDSTITNNTAALDGGGLYTNVNLCCPATITNSTISGNTAGLGGGGVFNFAGITAIEFSTITNNTAPNGQGSGVASLGDALTTGTEVLSSIIFANTNTDVDFVSGQTNTFVSRGYNLIGDGNAIWDFNQTGDQIDHFGVTNPGLGALADNGGPTQTHALLSGSPAIDAVPQGTNGCGTDITQDQRGVSRPQGSNCDKGSFELEKPDTEAPKVISTFPRNGGEGGPAANVRANFSEDMREASVMNAFKLFRKGSTNQIAATVTYDAATDIATLNPTNNLRRGVTYKAVVTTVAKDVAGNRLDQNSSAAGLQQKVWFFEID
jgi:CSLREA domain-containing protein